ncbi:MAG TPA: hypothetical protein VFH92_04495 [Phenylobacterium sp.]|nr:hypothetical protein [Phenylobacterium sp.]
MPLMVVYNGPGVTREAYAPYEAEIRAGIVPAEALMHQVAFDEEGLVVVDVWTSRSAFEAWTESTIKPTLARHKIPYIAPRVLDVEVVATPGASSHFALLKTPAPQPA